MSEATGVTDGSRFLTTRPEGLDRASFPMRLWEKSKRLGTWDPAAIDFSRDAREWKELGDDERDALLRLSSLFQAGEEAVVRDLIPLIEVVSAEGRLEEEIYLAAFLWEEAKHVDGFRRFFEEVAGDPGDLSGYHGPAYLELFARELPESLNRLRSDASPVAQAEASTTYHLVVEGVLAETGYHAYEEMLEREDLLPGTRELMGHVRRDESRHLAYGVYLLSRLMAEHGEPVWRAVEGRMEALLPFAVAIIDHVFQAYDRMPFGLDQESFTEYALAQFGKRMDRIEAARGRSVEEVMATFGG